jgi:hypothetical protein
MALDPDLADRMRMLVGAEENLTEQRMFGGLAFLVNGHMAVAASGEGGMLVRADPQDADKWLDGERVTPMVMRGREMRGWLRVADTGDEEWLASWVSRGLAYARSLPPKRR